ncbi:hypothetical protein F8154_13485 [Alkaliphilus pronyensis]|uniref:Erythromycin esterase family protein n=1 Tax=Alkaliphilus pronyensis TaxID=1482732 RepID=A0A6I0EX05_9FIRM|nr:hypothetical protein [Alkaliphilus pronyensis]KAB3530927.1 hypothetical protein F8154_13485 [Alkaliphilus pronyensis]
MKNRTIFAFVMWIIMILVLSACSNSGTQSDISTLPTQSSGQIYLYGEIHGNENILDKKFELWYEKYHNQGMRHLFIESAYFTAEFLNIWMKADNNEILDAIYRDWSGTLAQNPKVREFYKKIKKHCPETIFHGTDIGHQYHTTGQRFLEYLRNNNLETSHQYLLAQEAIDQGKHFYRNHDRVYRENKMVENFIREFDKLSGESIMGSYGAAHTGLEAMNYTNSVPSMANQLKEYYGDIIHSKDLSYLAMVIEPYRVDIIEVLGKEYEAMYFGKVDISAFSKDYAYREFWRLENAYDDFMDRPKTGYVLPYDNYPMLVETGQIFVIDYTKTDGSVMRMYYRSDGYVWNNKTLTEGFIVE